jgi:hypothetical protein
LLNVNCPPPETTFAGAVKVTPAHDPVDFEMSERQHLPIVKILNPDATMNEQAGPYAGLDRFACRQKVLADFEKVGLLEKIEQHHHSVGHCGRCQTMVEPEVSKQWFVKVAPLAEAAIKAVTDGKIAIVPERFTKVYLNWLENIRDWCISRQLWWGHRIPAWYCRTCGEIVVAMDTPKKCPQCQSEKLAQDADTPGPARRFIRIPVVEPVLGSAPSAAECGQWTIGAGGQSTRVTWMLSKGFCGGGKADGVQLVEVCQLLLCTSVVKPLSRARVK